MACIAAGNALAEMVINSQEPLLRLDQALDIALQQNRSLENAGMEVDKAADGVQAARTRQLPRLELNLSESYNLTPQTYTFEAGTFGPVPAQDVEVDARQYFTTIVSLSVKHGMCQ
jgi:outer membrane protein TolC